MRTPYRKLPSSIKKCPQMRAFGGLFSTLSRSYHLLSKIRGKPYRKKFRRRNSNIQNLAHKVEFSHFLEVFVSIEYAITPVLWANPKLRAKYDPLRKSLEVLELIKHKIFRNALKLKKPGLFYKINSFCDSKLFISFKFN